MARRTKKASRRQRRHKGAGYSDGPDFIKGAPGYLVHHSFSGPQRNFSPLTDCTGNPMSHRPGYIAPGTDMSVRGGLPGWRGGKQRRKRGGAAYPPMARLDQFTGTPAFGVITPLPERFSNPSGSGGSVGEPNPYPPVVAAPSGGVIPKGANVPDGMNSPLITGGQKGGRYGMFPGMGPLNPMNGVGTSPGPFGRIACEVGSPNPLNPDPRGVQTMYTAPSTPNWVTGPPRAYSSLMRGGGNDNLNGAPAGVGGSGYSAANFPMIQVGAADMMKYEAPTAGYGHAFQTFKAPSPVPALMINTPYDARTFNQACIKTGGSRRKRSKRGSLRKRSLRKTRGGTYGVGHNAGQWSRATMKEIGSRYDFDFSRKGLPVKFGGSRKKRRHGKHKTCRK
jgi:hypothetical protein